MIEEVDHVLDGSKTLSEHIGKAGYYDYIVASHVIEHVPDMLGFMKSCEALLRPDGVLLLAVPDKRHCFDVLQPLSTTGVVLQAHLDGHKRPTAGAVFDDRAYNAVRADAIGWVAGDTRDLRFFIGLDVARRDYDTICTDLGAYMDVHIWRFVPSSFRLIAHDLAVIGETGLREKAFYDSVGNEFYVSLSRSAAGCPVDRLTLARQMLTESATVRQ